MATLPQPVREAVIRLAQGYASTTSQLERLIAWHVPDACQEARP